MKNKFVYHVSLVLEGGRSSIDHLCSSLRKARFVVSQLKSKVLKLINNGDLKKGDLYEIFIDRGIYPEGDNDYDFSDNIYYFRKVVK